MYGIFNCVIEYIVSEFKQYEPMKLQMGSINLRWSREMASLSTASCDGMSSPLACVVWSSRFRILTIRDCCTSGPITAYVSAWRHESMGCVSYQSLFILLNLPSTDFLLQSIAAHVDVHIYHVLPEDFLHFQHLAVDRWHDWDYKNLTRTQPKRPLPSKILRQDTKYSANDRSVNYHWLSVSKRKFAFGGIFDFGPRRILAGHLL